MVTWPWNKKPDESPDDKPTDPRPAGPMIDIGEEFALAQREQQAVNFAEAERLYRNILQFDPTHAQSIHFMGVATFQQGRADEGLELVRKSLELNGDDPNFWKNYLSLLLRHAGKSDEALDAARRVAELDKSCVDAHLCIGEAMLDKKQFDQAAAAFARALAINRDLANVRNSLAYALRQIGKRQDALTVLRQAVTMEPYNADLHSNLGAVLMELGELDQAAAACRQALNLRPNMAEAYGNLGGVLRRQGKLEEAANALQRAVDIKVDYPEAWLALGCVLWERERLSEAMASLSQAIKYRPDYVEAHANMGRVLRLEGRHADALAAYDKAVAVGPSDAGAHFSRGLLLLQMGRFEEGWPEYEWGWQNGSRAPKRDFAQPLWDGGDLAGRTIFLSCEQGMGDVIQFARYATLAAQRGGKVVMECQPPLLRLIETVKGVDQVVAVGSTMPRFDAYCPLLSLPGVFRTTLESVPRDVPYLQPAEIDVAEWDQRLGRDGRIRVGLAWAGNPLTKTAQRKFITPELLKPILSAEGVSFYSLQVDLPPNDAMSMSELGVRDLSANLTDFAQTAAAIGNMDLVIAVDTAVAHLAGALAKPAWIMLPFAADWRRLLDRDDSPWYPTMRLFRQSSPGDWKSVIERVGKALLELLS